MRAPRPVAGLPALDPSELAHAWLVELVTDGSLQDAAQIDTAAFARDAPPFCAAVLAALQDDVPLPPAPADTEALRQAATRVLRSTIPDREIAIDAIDRLAHVALKAAGAPPLETALKALTEPFALVAAELTHRHDDPEPAAGTLRALLHAGDQLLEAERGRWWLLLPGADATAARRRVADITDGTLAFGIAACPHDGADPEALIAHADEALFSARAAGLPVA